MLKSQKSRIDCDQFSDFFVEKISLEEVSVVKNRIEFIYSIENEKINLDELEDLESLYSHSMWARLGNGKQKVKY